MADNDADIDDQWLYGDAPDHPLAETEKQDLDSNAEDKLLQDSDPETSAPGENEEAQPDEESAPLKDDVEEEQSTSHGIDGDDSEEKVNGEKADHETTGNHFDDEDDEDDDDSDDDVNVVIGDIKTSPTYAPLNIKRGALITTVGDKSKLQQAQTGKFAVDEFEQMGMINGVPAGEYSVDSIEDKPWRKPGADITDYFNYGFNEDTWKAYCERQKRIRVNDSGVGLGPLNVIGMPRGPVTIMNDNSKYSGSFVGVRKAGPPPGRRMTGAIDVIGTNAMPTKIDAPKENIIQVMTADRREYSRKPPGFPDMSMPPPQSFEEFQPEFGFNPEPEPFYGGYEPTQDVQWAANNAAWTPNEIKSLTPGPGHPLPVPLPPVNQPPPIIPPIIPGPGPVMPPNGNDRSVERIEGGSPPRRADSRERDHESRARSEKPRERDRDRERSHRRERSRSRSRRHKSRSRSPSHRSHRKKKSRRHEDSD